MIYVWLTDLIKVNIGNLRCRIENDSFKLYNWISLVNEIHVFKIKKMWIARQKVRVYFVIGFGDF